ncbi:MAG: GAF domain-containing protein [Thermoflavifilum sp.]|nr:GAF domain-containing protein [Thermoflavifilum sp.]MCL6514421.1 GAF domain-containing protein [Alicyclobacillus sp.]
MYEHQAISAATKAEFYEALGNQLRHLMDGEPSPLANLSNASALLYAHLTDINWAGFYLWSDADQCLILGPFQGKPACIRIPAGKGVCGTAWSRGETVVVPDVHQFPGHIACDPASRSEIVVPLRTAEGRAVGVLDIDSPQTGRFDDEDARGLEAFARVLGAGCDWRRLSV